MKDQHTHPTPTLDEERTEQLRTFLTVEAAADVAAASAPLRSGRRRLALGALTAVLLAGGLLASTTIIGSPGASRADAVAIQEDDGWINIRIVDVDADPEAVVDELRAAGIDARVGEPGEAGVVAGPGAGGEGITGLSVETADGNGVGMVSVGPGGALPVPDGGPPIEVPSGVDPDDPSITAPAVTTVDAVEATGEVSGSTGVIAGSDTTSDGDVALPAPDISEDLDASGVRFEDDGSISIRAGADVTVLVFST